MKSIKDYVSLEQKFYEGILNRYDVLFEDILTSANVNDFKEIVIYATGSSLNAAYGALPFMNKCLDIPIRIEEPSIIKNYLPSVGNEVLNIAISQGGHSYSVIELVKMLQQQGKKVFVFTSELESPLAKASENIISMGMPVEEMPYVSAGYSVLILDLMLLSLKLAIKTGKLTSDDELNSLKQIQQVVNKMPEVIKSSEIWISKLETKLAIAKRIIFIGYGATYGVAREGETKITETVRISSWGKELEEYMHGPYLGLKNEDIILFVEPNGRLKERANLLKKFLNKYVTNVVTIYANEGSSLENDLQLAVNVPEEFTALFMTIPIHLMSYRLSKLKGIDLTVSAYPDFDQITASKI